MTPIGPNPSWAIANIAFTTAATILSITTSSKWSLNCRKALNHSRARGPCNIHHGRGRFTGPRLRLGPNNLPSVMANTAQSTPPCDSMLKPQTSDDTTVDCPLTTQSCDGSQPIRIKTARLHWQKKIYTHITIYHTTTPSASQCQKREAKKTEPPAQINIWAMIIFILLR